jgi:hypothetical protein
MPNGTEAETELSWAKQKLDEILAIIMESVDRGGKGSDPYAVLGGLIIELHKRNSAPDAGGGASYVVIGSNGKVTSITEFSREDVASLKAMAELGSGNTQVDKQEAINIFDRFLAVMNRLSEKMAKESPRMILWAAGIGVGGLSIEGIIRVINLPALSGAELSSDFGSKAGIC